MSPALRAFGAHSMLEMAASCAASMALSRVPFEGSRKCTLLSQAAASKFVGPQARWLYVLPDGTCHSSMLDGNITI